MSIAQRRVLKNKFPRSPTLAELLQVQTDPRLSAEEKLWISEHTEQLTSGSGTELESALDTVAQEVRRIEDRRVQQAAEHPEDSPVIYATAEIEKNKLYARFLNSVFAVFKERYERS